MSIEIKWHDSKKVRDAMQAAAIQRALNKIKIKRQPVANASTAEKK